MTGREIIVPPNPGAMGAWGIGLCIIKELGKEALQSASRLALNNFLAAEIIDRSEFTCKDGKCRTMCPIERTTIQFGDIQKVATSGGACPKYEISAQSMPELIEQSLKGRGKEVTVIRPRLYFENGLTEPSVIEALQYWRLRWGRTRLRWQKRWKKGRKRKKPLKQL